MEKKVFKTKFALPPNVNGRCRGRLSLCLHEIKWHNVEPFQFNCIRAKLIWWGDKFHSGATLKLTNKKKQSKSFGHAIHYNILTKLTLFKKYLLSSECVDVKFSSGISNIDIGVATLPVPVDLIAFIDDQQSQHSMLKSKQFRTKCHIFNSQNKFIGEMCADYEMLVYDRVFHETEMFDEISLNKRMDNDDKRNVGIENNMNQFNLDLNLTDVKLKRTVKKKFKSKSPNKYSENNQLGGKMSVLSSKQISINSPKTSPLISYLTGRPLDVLEESEAVRAMESTSPTESLIDLLSFDLDGLYLPKTGHDAEANILKKIDCLRIQISELCLTRAGTREILSKHASNEMSFSSGTFTIDVDIDPILASKSSFDKNATFSSKVTRIFSSSIETIPPCVEFNRATVHRLNAFCIKNRNTYVNGIVSLVIRYRDIESCASQILGTARFQLADVIEANNFTYQQHCPVKMATTEIIVGKLTIKAELGCRGLHFGADFLEAISLKSLDIHKQRLCNDFYDPYQHCSPFSTNLLYQNKGYNCYEYDLQSSDLFHETYLNDIHDEKPEDKSENPSTPLNMETHLNNAQKINGNKLDKMTDEMANKDVSHELSKSDELPDESENELKGLLHIGQINYCSWYQSVLDTFLVCRPFWTDLVLVTESCQNKTRDENYQLNYLEIFSVICDQKLFESTKHGFMSIEVWQQGNSQTNSLVGSAKIPLHQFFIAFNNNSIRNHVNRQELPVISIDGWVTIANATSPNSTPIGTVQAILAVGNTKQINNLKRSKSLVSYNSFMRLPLEMYPFQTNHPPPNQSSSTDVHSKTETNTKNALPSMMSDRHSNLASMFSSFIDNLASKLPDRNLATTETVTNDATTQTNNGAMTNTSNTTGKYMRPTSELLDELQRALSIAPTSAQKNAFPHVTIPTHDHASTVEPPTMDSVLIKKSNTFRVHIEIESALHLPSIAVHVSKKGGKRNRNANTNATKKNGTEPSTYATFEATATNVLDALTSYTTNIVENSCSPQWNKHFEVYLPAECLQNDEKRFVIRVWRTTNETASKARQIPNSNDVTIGCASVDLSVLLAGLPSISGWFNIIDHSGCINGQIKIHIKPKDDITSYQKQVQTEMIMQQPDSEVANHTQKMDPLPSNETPHENRSIDDSALSRALKRKFTELEEITQRLRARLFDVTGNMAIDPDDQFENDLNTIPDEDDDNFEESNIASEMSLDWLEHCHNQASSNDSTDESNLIATQMRDILDFLSPNMAQFQSSSTHDALEKNIKGDDFQLNRTDRSFETLNEDGLDNERVNDVKDSVENIAKSLEKSIINE